MKNKISEAVRTLCIELEKDPDYRLGWQANIAMSIKDEFDRTEDKTDMHGIANRGADNFLKLLCRSTQ